jgi:DNA-binding MarR family transcriptional regulator
MSADTNTTKPASAPRRDAKAMRLMYQDLADFRLHLRRFLAFSEASARTAGVTSQHYQAMLVIAGRGPDGLAVKDLAAELMLAPNGAVQLVDRMVRQDLLRREPSPTDGRSVLLALTAKGTRTFRRLAANHVAELMTHRAHLAASLDHLEQLQGTTEDAPDH